MTRNVTGNSVSERKQKRLRCGLSFNPGEIPEPPGGWAKKQSYNLKVTLSLNGLFRHPPIVVEIPPGFFLSSALGHPN